MIYIYIYIYIYITSILYIFTVIYSIIYIYIVLIILLITTICKSDMLKITILQMLVNNKQPLKYYIILYNYLYNAFITKQITMDIRSTRSFKIPETYPWQPVFRCYMVIWSPVKRVLRSRIPETVAESAAALVTVSAVVTRY